MRLASLPLLFLSVACSPLPGATPAPEIDPRKAALAASKSSSSEDVEARLRAILERESPDLRDSEQASARTRALAELAALQLDRGAIPDAMQSIDRAVREVPKSSDRELRRAIHHERSELVHRAVLDLGKSKDYKAALRLLDALAVDPELKVDERAQIIGDRLVILDLQGDLPEHQAAHVVGNLVASGMIDRFRDEPPAPPAAAVELATEPGPRSRMRDLSQRTGGEAETLRRMLAALDRAIGDASERRDQTTASAVTISRPEAEPPDEAAARPVTPTKIAPPNRSRGTDAPSPESLAMSSWRGPSLERTRDAMPVRLGQSLEIPVAETGEFDAVLVERIVGSNKKSVESCYTRSIKRGEKLDGRFEVEIAVLASGNVSTADVLSRGFQGTKLAKCVSETIRGWKFPPFNGEAQRVEVPFLLYLPKSR